MIKRIVDLVGFRNGNLRYCFYIRFGFAGEYPTDSLVKHRRHSADQEGAFQNQRASFETQAQVED